MRLLFCPLVTIAVYDLCGSMVVFTVRRASITRYTTPPCAAGVCATMAYPGAQLGFLEVADGHPALRDPRRFPHVCCIMEVAAVLVSCTTLWYCRLCRLRRVQRCMHDTHFV
eukprot:TRINITY_DN26517_c0_g1_i1.p3 TRINITY_DN26517_c0_g1~~TRINITY_DN26517_c0_g1_i1.p3  ORF type:complete len:112 (-),score=4.61 TRINITY_DN26517_c0_g1_i1:977-1312(-)